MQKLLRFFGILKHKEIKKTRKAFKFKIHDGQVVTINGIYPKIGQRQNKRLVCGFEEKDGIIYVNWHSMTGVGRGSCKINTLCRHFDVPSIGDLFGDRKIPDGVDYIEDAEFAENLFANLQKYLDDNENL